MMPLLKNQMGDILSFSYSVRCFIARLFHPKLWFLRAKYSEEWDENLNDLLDLYEIEILDDDYILLGRYKLVTLSYPNYYFIKFGSLSLLERPSASTLLRCKKLYKKAKLKLLEEKNERQ